jgi:aconitate hydratase
MTDAFNTLASFATGTGTARFFSLDKLAAATGAPIARLPASIRIVLESVLRHCDGKRATEAHVRQLANWQPNARRVDEIPFVVSRVILQDFTGVPLLADLAAMRDAAVRAGRDPKIIEPLVPVDMVVDHSVQVDFANTPDALMRNMEIEFARNRERYQFLKWGMQAFETFKVVPPGVGIVHQVNLEYLARGVMEKDGVVYPDTLVGTDSHTTMINGVGVVGWGVGGIEAEAAMLGQPVYFLTPDVVGVHLKGRIREGVTATDVVLTVTEILRSAKVVGKFVEFFGEGATALPVTDRATIANMAPEYGATMGFFGVDEATCQYFLATGRPEAHVATLRNYYQAQGLFGIPTDGQCDYSSVIELDLGSVVPSIAGPKRPQDRIELNHAADKFRSLFAASLADGGFAKPAADLKTRHPLHVASVAEMELVGGGNQDAPEAVPRQEQEMLDSHPADHLRANPATVFGEHSNSLGHGDVVIAAITSCTNTSNPGVMLAAGILAKKAVARGLKAQPWVKTSLAPGSRVVTEYLNKTGLQTYLDQVGFKLVGYGCTTCIGNSGPLAPEIETAIADQDLVVASVLSGNRNFEARVHAAVKANFLMSPPLVVAYAIAGRMDIDITTEPLSTGSDGQPVYLKELWPSLEEVNAALPAALDPASYRALYQDLNNVSPLWGQVQAVSGATYQWDAASTYIQPPPFFQMAASTKGDIRGARALAVFGDSVTTDHISPAGSIKASTPAGRYLVEQGVAQADFNSYGARRGNHEIMMRGTFANVRIKNRMIPGSEGGVTRHLPDNTQMAIYDAAMLYEKENTPLIVFAGEEYGTGSSRDWAAKGTRLQGIRAVVAKSFERIHRANLAGMGVLPCQFKPGVDAASLGITGDETFDLQEIENGVTPQQDVTLVIHRADGSSQNVPLILRIDTPIEVDYYNQGGILPFVLGQLIG